MAAPEPPVGATARDEHVHEWRHEPDGWWGCFTCDPDDLHRWEWAEIVADVAVEAPAGADLTIDYAWTCPQCRDDLDWEDLDPAWFAQGVEKCVMCAKADPC